jgi:hypothetical protein
MCKSPTYSITSSARPRKQSLIEKAELVYDKALEAKQMSAATAALKEI